MLTLLPQIVDGFAANILAYAVLLAAVATITMALLELAKAIVRVRLHYHRRMVSEWVGPDAYRELLLLAVAEVESAGALFDQPTDKMMGQIQSAANVALDFPELYPAFYGFLTRAPRSDAARRETGDGASAATDDAAVWRTYSRMLDLDRTGDDALPPGAQAAMRARARLDHFTTRKLDAFQTRTEYIWARANQLVAVVGCGAFILVILASLPLSLGQKVMLAAFGGMIAPFAKDVVTALGGLRARAT